MPSDFLRRLRTLEIQEDVAAALYLSAGNLQTIRIGADTDLSRLAASVMGPATGDSYAVDILLLDSANRDVSLSRGAANRLDLASGDSLNLVLGDITLAATRTVDGIDVSAHDVATTGVHGVGAGNIVGTSLTQVLTDKTLTTPAINGVVTTTGLTLPAFTAGGNITLTGLAQLLASWGNQSFTNLLENGSFEVGDPPTRWAVESGTWSRSTTQAKIDSYSAKCTQTSEVLNQDIPTFSYYKGRKVTLGCWVYASVASAARLRIADGVSSDFSSYHTGVAGWEWLTVTRTINAAATLLRGSIRSEPAAPTDVYFDGAVLVEGEVCPAFLPKPDGALINHHTAAYTISAYETGFVLHTNLGAAGAIVLTLPQTVSAGFTCRFAVMAAQELRIDPGAAGAIYINGAKQTDDKYITADDEAESVLLTADGNGDWIASSVVGTWSVEV